MKRLEQMRAYYRTHKKERDPSKFDDYNRVPENQEFWKEAKRRVTKHQR